MEKVSAAETKKSLFKIKRLDGDYSEKNAAPLQADLVANPFAAFEDKADTTVPTATLQIYQFVDSFLERQSSTEINRASSASQCHKKRWYKKRGYEEKPMAPRAVINFTLGDLTERVVQYWISKALVGEGKLYSEVDFGEVTGSINIQGKEFILYKQQTLAAQVGDIQVSAHADGFGKRNSDGKWELIEIKSAAPYGFDSFKKTGPEDYLKQSHVLMRTERAIGLGVESVRFFYMKKDTGHLWDRTFDFDPILWAEVISDYAIAQNSEGVPVSPYQLKQDKKGRSVAQFPCTYCPYLAHCHGPHSVVWESGAFGVQKPVYVFGGSR